MILWDERLTTVAAERVLMESGVRRENRKESVDQIGGGHDSAGISGQSAGLAAADGE